MLASITMPAKGDRPLDLDYKLLCERENRLKLRALWHFSLCYYRVHGVTGAGLRMSKALF